MNTNEYLQKILSQQDLPDDSQELKVLQEHRKKVEKILVLDNPALKDILGTKV